MNLAAEGVGDWTQGVRGSASHSYFRRSLQGQLISSRFQLVPPRTVRGSNAAARRGLSFEKKVLKNLTSRFGFQLHSQLSFFFETDHGQRGTIIPDGLLFTPDFKRVLLIEVKLRHSGDAWYQTNKFYKPVIEKAFPKSVEVIPVEVCQFYDPRVQLPQAVAVLDDIIDAFEVRRSFHPVLIRDKNGA